MIIQIFAHHHFRTCFTLFIHILNLVISKCTVCITESSIQYTVTRTKPHTGMIFVALTTVSITTTNRHIKSSTQT